MTQIIENKTKAEWLAQETAPRIVSLWGDSTPNFTPYLCKTTLGDGELLIYFGTLNQRPLYWLVLIDSNTDFEDFDIEEVITLIEEECGSVDDDDTDDDGEPLEENPMDRVEYPQIYTDGGHHYGKIVNFKTGEINY